MNIVDEINQQAMELWARTFTDEAQVRVPMIYPDMTKGALLFVGLNPAFGKRWSFLKGVEFENFKPAEFFAWRNRSTFDFEKAKRIERLALAEYAYFKKCQEIAKYVDLKMEHVDLFFYRETDQKAFLKVIYHDKHLNDLGKRQLELTCQLIAGLAPRAIVVVNAFASHLFGDQDGVLKSMFDARFDDKLGTYTVLVNRTRIPAFLASMLSGQRAMDIFSYERLKWHVKQCLQS